MASRSSEQHSDLSETPEEIWSKIRPSWKGLFGFTTRTHIPTLVFGALTALLAGCVTPALAIFLGNLFNTFTTYGAGQIDAQLLRSNVASNCLRVVVVGVAGWLLNGAYFTAFVGFGELQAFNVRSQIFSELLYRDVEWFEARREGSGAFLSSAQAHINDLQLATSQPLGLLLQYSFRSLASLGLAFYTSWNLTIITLAGIPIFSGVISILSSRMKTSITKQQAQLTHASKVANNAITSIDTVKCLNAQEFESRNFSARIQVAGFHYLRQARLNSLQIALICWMMFGMFVQGFWYGSALAREGSLTSGEVLRTFWACLTAAQSIEQLLPQMLVMEKGKVASSTLKAILNSRSGHTRADETRGTLYPEHCEGDIEFDHVSFSYPSQPDKCVLQPSSLFFPAGDTTFVIGKSGSGKSTLSQLLMRFYVPTSGGITIDGNPLESLSTTWIRNNITLVEQRSVLFNDSVYQNITFGRQDHESIPDEELEQAIALAMLQNTIEGLPNGLDTCVGPGGSFLSGGQRQRVAIARARLRDTPILILDEPTSALDHTNRVAVMKAIREWRKGKTTIIITHDMSQILEQDFVYILENGSVREWGYRHALEQCPDNAKYFPKTTRDETSPLSKEGPSDSPTSSSSVDNLEEMEPAMPPRVRQSRRVSWAQHHIPPSFRSSAWEMTGRRRAMSSAVLEEAVFNMIDEHVQQRYGHREQVNPESIEMTHIRSADTTTELSPRRDSDVSLRPSQPVHYGSNQLSRMSETQHETQPNEPASLKHIMGTVFSTLNPKGRSVLALGFLSALGHASATPLFAYCLSQLFGTFKAGNNSAQLAKTWALAVLGVSIGDGIASFFMHYLLEVCGQAWMDALRREAFHRILNQPRAWFEREENSSSKLTSYLDQNGEDMRNLLGRFAGFVIVAAAITVMAIIWSLVVCWKLTLVALACGPVIYIITRSFEGTNGLWERRCNEAGAIASDIFTETFTEIRTVRTLTLEGYFHHKQDKALAECVRVGLRRALWTGLLFGLVESTVICASALIFYYASVLAAAEFSVNSVMTVISMLLFSMGYAAQVLSWIPQINTSREIASQLLRLAGLPENDSHEHRGTLTTSQLTPIQLTNLNFRYPSRPKTLVLKNVSIKISPNSCTAIVGRSGSGKSTIASLLLALYEAPVSRNGQATITLGGKNILRLHVPTLRSQIAIVSQQPTIFPGTIQANISYGLENDSPLTTLHQVRAAAQAAGVDDFISSLPQGYATVIGDGGIGISGGQKQRVVIARALLRQPQILILDEATSSLDPAGAAIVRHTVQQLVSARRDMTVIIITHAREMIEIADHVIVLDQGVVVEDGAYSTLSRRVGGKLHALMHDSDSDSEAYS